MTIAVKNLLLAISVLAPAQFSLGMDLRRVEKICQNFVESRNTDRSRFREALMQRDAKNFTTAHLILTELLTEFPEDHAARSLRAAILLNLGRTQEAVNDLQFVLDREGPNEPNIRALAIALERNRQTDHAIEILRRGIQLHPSEPRLAEIAIEILLRRSRHFFHLDPQQSQLDLNAAKSLTDQARLEFPKSKRFLELKASIHVLLGNQTYACLLIKELTKGNCTEKVYAIFETKVQSSFPIGPAMSSQSSP